MQQNTCATVCWSTSCNIWHPLKDLGSCYCDMHPTMEQLSSMHHQWFHILPCMDTPLWMQCQSSWHCPKWHNHHTAGSKKTLLFSGATCITPTCTMHAAHICCTCTTGNPDETGSSCSCHVHCSEECPSTNACEHPMPHLCSHEDPAMPTWHQDAWSRRSRKLLTRTVHGPCYHNVPLHTSPVICFTMYHNLRKGDVAWLLHLDLRTGPSITWPHFAEHIYIGFPAFTTHVNWYLEDVDMFQCFIINSV